jgi:hypothetical protein
VNRSLEAANAIRAGNSSSLIASISILVVLEPALAVRRQNTPHKLAVRLARQFFTIRKPARERAPACRKFRLPGRKLRYLLDFDAAREPLFTAYR